MRSERWMTPGTYSRPAEPMPFTRPNFAPLADTHSGPFAPSTTCGMRSLNWADAFLVKRSGGSQIRSTWPSAEMTSYFMSTVLRRRSSLRKPWLASLLRHRSAIHTRPGPAGSRQQHGHGRERQDEAHRQDGFAAQVEAHVEVAQRQRRHQHAAGGVHPGVRQVTEALLA